MALRGAAPDVWARFVSEMGKEAIRTTMRMVSADQALLPRAQGMSIQANEIAGLLVNAPTLFEKFQEARIKRNARTNAR